MDEFSVDELCNELSKAFYEGDNETALAVALELIVRCENSAAG